MLFLPAYSEVWAANFAETKPIQTNGLRVQNLNTTLSYSTIQEAINAEETTQGHVIHVASGVYPEHLSVTKALSIIGENPSSTIIDALGGTAVHIQSDNVEIRNFTLLNGTFGILVDNSENAKLIDNVLSKGSYGIRLNHSRNAQLIRNHISTFKSVGIELDSSGNNLLRNNQIEANKYNFGVEGQTLTDFLNDIDESNTVDSKPIRYLVNQHGLVVDSLTQDVGYVGLVNSTNITVENLDVQNNRQGVLFAFVANSAINAVNAFNNWDGISIIHSRNISVNWVKANNNNNYGIKFLNASRSSAIGNNANNNGWTGIGLLTSPNSILDKNEANFNFYNLHLLNTNNSVVTRNNASGLAPEKPNSYSIAVYYSHNNRIYHNSFSTSLVYAESGYETTTTPENKWDNGQEGNYWLNQHAQDNNHDGISDTAYTLAENNVDNFPLMGRFWDFIVLFQGRLYGVTIISNSTISRFELNFNNATINLDVKARNGTVIFFRITIPHVLTQKITNNTLNLVVDDQQPTLLRNWTDANNHNWYFWYIHSVNPTPENHNAWPVFETLLISAALLSLGLIAFIALKTKRARSHKQTRQSNSKNTTHIIPSTLK